MILNCFCVSGTMQSTFPPQRPAESTHHRLIEFVKTALINIFVSPYATVSLPASLVCDLYCGKVTDEEKWDEAQIGHYIGIDVATSGVSEVREAWESRHKAYTSEFLEFDPCIEDVDLHWKNKENQADIVFCMQHLPLCVETEEKLRRLLHNVSSLLKPGGYFLGITPDSSTIWAKYQKNVEGFHNKSGGIKPSNFPNSIRSESYMITFEVEEEKFPFFGKRYLLKFAGDMSSETHCLVHFPSLIRLAREAGIDYIEIQNLTDFYDDNRTACCASSMGPVNFMLLVSIDVRVLMLSTWLLRAQLAGLLMDAGHNFVDPRGRLLPRSYDVLGLYTVFIFQKPDPDIAPPLMTPLLEDGSHNHDEASVVVKIFLQGPETALSTRTSGSFEVYLVVKTRAALMPPRERQAALWREDDKNTQPESSSGLAKITEQKGILGPGPVELRFSEAL
ncbi:mRNA cap guanine-N7 methyltransferase [Striga asiatica]|uniref:mRNA (guanine-N(7))-methyltransferase n=1 Tax=Striga asiatica TaxID=4170 RepID=A0A5A7P890_STRAF|nr:mRNA cap guanine-N7 methyltransferase [Striga asiatica]